MENDCTRDGCGRRRRWRGEGGRRLGDATVAQGGGQVGGHAGELDQLSLAQLGGGGDDGLAALHEFPAGLEAGRERPDGGDHQLHGGGVPRLVGIAREHGLAGYLGDGSNRWPFVHRLDAARLFRLAAERAPAGSVLHAVGDEGVAIRDLAEVMSRHLGVPAGPVAAGDAAGHFGFLGGFIGIDSPATAERTRALLGWEPAGAGMLEDLDQGHYFGSPE
jgi:hypothetical protein